MFRLLISYLALFALGFCLFSTTLQIICGSNSCSETQTYDFQPTETHPSCSPFDDCGKTSGTQSSSGCCICLPNCCVYLVPEIKYELYLTTSGEFSVQLFDDQHFALQSVDFSIWRPPVFEI